MRVFTISLASLLLLAAIVNAARFNFRNQCADLIYRWDNSNLLAIPASGVHTQDVWGSGLMWRNGYNPEATLAEFTINGDGRIWYDISVIPPGTFWCKNFTHCQTMANGRKGFNTAMAIIPLTNDNGYNCRALYCMHPACEDAYLFPMDNTKVHNCPDTTEFDIIFCPGGVAIQPTLAPSTPAPTTPDPTTPTPTTPAPTTPFPTTDEPPDDPTDDDPDEPTTAPPTTTPPPATTAPPTTTPPPATTDPPTSTPPPPVTTAPPTPPPSPFVRANFEYWGEQAGNVPGWYARTLDLLTCSRQRVDVNNPIGPLSEEVSLIFRGPMDIYNISVFDMSSTSYWKRVSWYRRGRGSENLVFFNNKNIDYVGPGLHSPQIFASADGNGTSTEPVAFRGKLAEASDPTQRYGGPGISTGVEVNILTAKKCLDDRSDCVGAHKGDYNYHGWGGGRKIFVTRVRMPMSRTAPNTPAIWMLNTQTMYTGQYNPCNCRGMGKAGGCGELDIAEVIENQNPRLDRVSTHHYFYDGSVENPPGGDNFASRPTTQPATYVTIMDETVKHGLIKIIQIDYFNFSLDRLNQKLVQRWIDA